MARVITRRAPTLLPWERAGSLFYHFILINVPIANEVEKKYGTLSLFKSDLNPRGNPLYKYVVYQ